MGSQIALWLDSENVPQTAAAFEQVRALFAANEQCLSRFRPDSELMQLNARSGQWVTISDLLWREVVLAVEMARQDDIELTESHWEVIEFLREYYDQYQIAPAIRILTKAMARKLGREKGNTRYLYKLFPQGPAKQACRYAGLPKPTGCV